jgi:F0F1-type ATP synthase assembly protein I
MTSQKPGGNTARESWADRYAAGRSPEEVRRDLWRDVDSGWVMVAELVAATLTWGGVGWLLDRQFDLAPVLMSIGFVLGFATGFYLLWARSTGAITTRRTPPSATHAPSATYESPADDHA